MYDSKLEQEIIDCCEYVVALEDRFIDLAFEMGPVEGMQPTDIKNYIRYIADWRLKQQRKLFLVLKNTHFHG